MGSQDPRNPSNRQKLMRFNSKMEQEHGLNWRKVMENEDAEEGAAEKASSGNPGVVFS